MITQIVTIYFESGATQILKLSNLFKKSDSIDHNGTIKFKDNLTALVDSVACGERVKNHTYERI